MENERKEQKSSETELKLKGKIQRIKLHLIYISIIFSAVIITILSLHFYSDDLNSKFVGYAATISSLILSVLAIIITVISNDSTNGLMHKIRDIYEAISATPEKISNSVECITHASDSLDSSVKSITEISEKIEELSRFVNSDLKLLKKSNDELSGILKSELTVMSSKIDQRDDYSKLYIENNIDSNVSTENNKIEYATADDVKVNFDQAMLSTSSYGLVILYASYISFKNKRDLNLEKLTNGIVRENDHINKDYAFKYLYGYLLGLNFVQGIIEYRAFEDLGRFEIISFNKELGEKFEKKSDELFLHMEKEFDDFFNKNLKESIVQSVIK